MVGTVAMTEAAKSGPQAVVFLPIKSASPTGRVKRDGLLIIVTAVGNSSQAALKVNIETTARAGTESGTIRLLITRKVPAPSNRNASSYSRGIPWKNPRRKKIVKGRLLLTYRNVSPTSELIRWSRVEQQVLRDQQEQAGHSQGGQEGIEDELLQRERVAGERERGQRGESDRDYHSGNSDEEAVEEVVAEAVLGPGLHVVTACRMGRDQGGRAEDPTVGLKGQREHVEEWEKRDQGQDNADDEARLVDPADAEKPGLLNGALLPCILGSGGPHFPDGDSHDWSP